MRVDGLFLLAEAVFDEEVDSVGDGCVLLLGCLHMKGVCFQLFNWLRSSLKSSSFQGSLSAEATGGCSEDPEIYETVEAKVRCFAHRFTQCLRHLCENSNLAT